MKKTIVIILASFFSLPVCAEPILNPNNGHYYERITGDITWTDAKSAAEGMSNMCVNGHLATITSDEENWWMVENLGGELILDHWLGGYLDEGNWKWVTGEPWDYTNWWDGYGWTEPSGDGDAIEFDDAEQSPPIPGYWNDLDKNRAEKGFIVEFDQIPDTDGDGTPDCMDNCPNDQNKIEPGVCGCGISDNDKDLDGTPDCNDNCSSDPNKTQPGVCGCGIADTDSDGDSIPDCNDDCDNLIDADGDGINDCEDLCPYDPNKTQPGTCGCSIADIDSDEDGTFDCMDSNDDDDGLPDGEEQGPDRNNPNYDGNGDGIADYVQGNVASFHTYNDQNYITIVSPSGTSIKNCKAVNIPSVSNSPQDVDFTHGFFGFSIDGVAPGDAITATMYFPARESFNTYFKYGPTPDNPINHWYEFLHDGQTGVNINGNVITLHFVDGMRGDDDLTTNGTISDIGAPGVIIDSGDSGAPVDSGSGGGGGGCFISTTVD